MTRDDEDSGVRHALKLRHYVKIEATIAPGWRQVDAMECDWGDPDEITHDRIADLVKFLGHDRVKLRLDHTYAVPRTMIAWETSIHDLSR